MSYQTIKVHNSTPHIGAEIRGVDLSNPLGNQQFQEVHDALMDRLVIFFRDQKLGIEQHKDFARRFGKLHMHPASPDVVSDHPEVLVIKADDKAKYIAGEDWHSDVSCDPEPPMGAFRQGLKDTGYVEGDSPYRSGRSPDRPRTRRARL
jgi:alpha-ketoglutarate-dependent taurine dioxygenase